MKEYKYNGIKERIEKAVNCKNGLKGYCDLYKIDSLISSEMKIDNDSRYLMKYRRIVRTAIKNFENNETFGITKL